MRLFARISLTCFFIGLIIYIATLTDMKSAAAKTEARCGSIFDIFISA